MKKILKGVMILVIVSALILMTGTAESTSLQVIWTLGCMAVVTIGSKVWERLFPEDFKED